MNRQNENLINIIKKDNNQLTDQQASIIADNELKNLNVLNNIIKEIKEVELELESLNSKIENETSEETIQDYEEEIASTTFYLDDLIEQKNKYAIASRHALELNNIDYKTLITNQDDDKEYIMEDYQEIKDELLQKCQNYLSLNVTTIEEFVESNSDWDDVMDSFEYLDNIAQEVNIKKQMDIIQLKLKVCSRRKKDLDIFINKADENQREYILNEQKSITKKLELLKKVIKNIK